LNERHSYRVIRDLLAYKDQIFGALKRASTSARPRAISTDESQRRQHVEARNRAVIHTAKSRSSSPAAPALRHGRQVSSDVTRFPINTSPTNSSPRSSGGRFKQRESLEVPGSAGEAKIDTPTATEQQDSPDSDSANRTSPPPQPAAITAAAVARSLEKKNSLGRSGHASTGRFRRGNAGLARNMGQRDSVASDGSDEQMGVTLTDKPMAEY